MVLEALINPLIAEKRPAYMIFFGFFYCVLSLLLALNIFPDQASLVFVFLTVMCCLPLIYATMNVEEEKDMDIPTERSLLREHRKAIYVMAYLFLGFVLAVTFGYLFFPESWTTSLFSVQSQTINAINNDVTGRAGVTLGFFSKIILNNFRVLVFCVAFSFAFGAGSLFILVWNASVIGVAVGNFIRSHVSSLALSAGYVGIGSYFKIYSLSLFRYAIHGIPEILAYIVAALAGGIISAAVIQKHFFTLKGEKILVDIADLLALSLFLLVVAAFLEAFVTPPLMDYALTFL